MLAYGICFPLSDLLHSVWQSLGRISSFKSTREDSRQGILAQMPAEKLTTSNQDSEAEEHCRSPLEREEHSLGMRQQVKNDLKEPMTANNNGTEQSTEMA